MEAADVLTVVLAWVSDIAVSGLLLAAGWYSLRAWRRSSRHQRGARYWQFAGIGLIYLAFDELLALHESANRLGEWAGVPPPPPFERIDDAIIILFVVGGLAISARYAEEIARHPRVLRWLVAGFSVAIVGAILDSTVHGGPAGAIEELAEIVGATLFMLGLRERYRGAERAVLAAAPATSATGPEPAAEAGLGAERG